MQLKCTTLPAKMEASRPGGLFSLPRELRDEIYRYLLNGRYLSIQSWMHHERSRPPHMAKMAIFRVSKATFDEATSVFYSESVFIHHIDLIQWSTGCLPSSVSSCIRNVEFDFDTLSLYNTHDDWRSHYQTLSPHNIHYDWASYNLESQEVQDQIECTLNASLDMFSGRSIHRNTILIKLQSWSPNIHQKLYEYLFRRLKALVGFRMVTVDAGPGPGIFDGEVRVKGYRNLGLRLKEELVPIMGPAIVRQVDLITCLEFHPLKHMQANLLASADTSRVKMAKLHLETDRSG